MNLGTFHFCYGCFQNCVTVECCSQKETWAHVLVCSKVKLRKNGYAVKSIFYPEPSGHQARKPFHFTSFAMKEASDIWYLLIWNCSKIMALITYKRMRLCVCCGLFKQPYFNIILQFLLLLKSLILGGINRFEVILYSGKCAIL